MIKLKDFYEHAHDPSIFIMFRSNHEIVWAYSGSELRRIYLEDPDGFISEPLRGSDSRLPR